MVFWTLLRMSRLASRIWRLPVVPFVVDTDHDAVGELAGWNGAVGEGVLREVVERRSTGGQAEANYGESEAGEVTGRELLGRDRLETRPGRREPGQTTL